MGVRKKRGQDILDGVRREKRKAGWVKVILLLMKLVFLFPFLF